MVRLLPRATDRRGQYGDLAEVVSATDTDIRSFELRSWDAHLTGALGVHVENLVKLQRTLKAARRVKAVTAVTRKESLVSDNNRQSNAKLRIVLALLITVH
jgi:hypothetical protein